MVKYRLHLLNRALIFIALFYFNSELSWAQSRNIQSTGIWILRDGLYSPSSIDSALTFAANSGFDKVFVQVRSRGDALYESKFVKKNHRVQTDFDPLAYMIELGHELELEIHAWFNTYLIWSARKPPADTSHVYFTQNQWTEANHFGKMDWRIDISHPPSPDWEGIYLSPIHPEVNPYLIMLIKEIMENYSIDGIHLDYLRYQDDFYGYNPIGCEIFKNKYGFDPIDITRGIISTRFGWSQTEVDSINYLWSSFKKGRITDLLSSLRYEIDNEYPGIKLSAAVKPNIITAGDRWAQDWVYWIENGLLDFAVPMNYYIEDKDFLADLFLMKSAISESYLSHVMMGVATYNQEANSTAEKIIIARNKGFTTICVFSYNSHMNNLDWFYPVIDALERPLNQD
ncbi:MAG: family 10 glycosylhydrolase [Candidatus Marinimicrobia bacterium]|nr:family 10 glycosylhydrolase [Candidatus Neomarinimicrobiota bacterium]MBT3683078.1 family 10 glycosylhydrolase [Candidatus Neomarinimicrobiota bacterium]MBT3759830.1 family 10 glycosylhydrolase [Candidatus Neomarinimicrobiota bacterium]MBT3895717.1 family 10 glycosylhydrolase [Candidatus Neomarinimicrobiota bacterium]MBT4173244.1 family 10 glycosylhydrolase [Candidatus Neomarinimicrobiota bacterium]